MDVAHRTWACEASVVGGAGGDSGCSVDAYEAAGLQDDGHNDLAEEDREAVDSSDHQVPSDMVLKHAVTEDHEVNLMILYHETEGELQLQLAYFHHVAYLEASEDSMAAHPDEHRDEVESNTDCVSLDAERQFFQPSSNFHSWSYPSASQPNPWLQRYLSLFFHDMRHSYFLTRSNAYLEAGESRLPHHHGL
jgi:hypothetical protein